MGAKHAFVMMIQPKWWEGFRERKLQGKEIHSYVQRGLAPPKDASLILFYVTKPVAELAGYAEMVERKAGDADSLWNEHGGESVLTSKKQFEDFIGNRQKASFVRFKNLHELERPIPISNMLMLLGKNRLSRKGFYLDKEVTDRMLALME